MYKYARIFVYYTIYRTESKNFVLIKIVLKKYNKNQYKFEKHVDSNANL